MSETTDRDSSARTGSVPFTRGPWEIQHCPGDVWEVSGKWGVPIAEEIDSHHDAVAIQAVPELVDTVRNLLTLTNPFLTHDERQSHRVRRDAEKLLVRIGIEL